MRIANLNFLRLVTALSLLGTCSLSHAQDIVIGQCVPLTGTLAATGKNMVTGVRIAFEAVNAAGGINGNRIKHVVQDDGYVTDKTVSCTRDLINNAKASALIGYAGTGNIGELLKRKVLADADIALVAPYTGASGLREPYNPYIFHIRAGYDDEAAKMVLQFTRSGISKIGVFYQDDAFGESVLAGVQKALAHHGLKVASTGKYEKNTENIGAAVQAIAKDAPQAIIMVAVTRPAAAFVREIKKKLPGVQVFGISVINGQELYRLSGEEARGVGLTQVAPSPFAATVRIVSEYNEALKRFAPGTEASYTSLEEYIGARTLIEGLKRVKGVVSPSAVKSALEGVNLDFGGYKIAFGPNQRVGSKFVEVTLIGAGGTNLR